MTDFGRQGERIPGRRGATATMAANVKREGVRHFDGGVSQGAPIAAWSTGAGLQLDIVEWLRSLRELHSPLRSYQRIVGGDVDIHLGGTVGPSKSTLVLGSLVAFVILPTAAAANDAETCAKQSGDVAIAACSRAIRSGEYTGRNLAINYWDRGLEYKAKGDLDRALADYNEAIRLNPKEAKFYNSRGNVYQAKGDLDRALADYTPAIEIDPQFGDAYYNRGVVYQAKGDPDRAIADFNQASRLDPKYAKAYVGRGIAYKDKGDLDRAIADFNQAIALDPKMLLAYDSRGSAYQAKGDLDRAIADFNHSLALDPKYATNYVNRGNVYFAKGDYDRAITDYAEAIKLDPKFTTAYLNRGLAWEKKHDLQKALADYKRLAELNPSDPNGPALIARVTKALSGK